MIQLSHCSCTLMHWNILRYFDDIGSQRLLIVEDAVKIYLVHFITWSNWSETPAEREFLRRSKPISSQPCVISLTRKQNWLLAPSPPMGRMMRITMRIWITMHEDDNPSPLIHFRAAGSTNYNIY
jgi:hypothetical protein